MRRERHESVNKICNLFPLAASTQCNYLVDPLTLDYKQCTFLIAFLASISQGLEEILTTLLANPKICGSGITK